MDGHPGQAPPDAMRLLDAVRVAVARHRLLDPGDRVVVAVSGGPDSVALLHALTRLRAAYALELHVCHVHHGLRAEADQDATFVRDLAARLGCPATVERVRVPHAPGRSPEAAARAARYAALNRAACAVDATRLALGHTADDQAETVLMRFLQGAGPRGLAGIPVRRGRLIRPLLGVDRATVLVHLAAHGLRWVEDATNHDPKLLRNRVRHELIPLLAAHGWPRIQAGLLRTARASRETVEALDSLLAPRATSAVWPGLGGWARDLAGLQRLPPGATKALLRLALAEVVGRPEVRAGLRASHLDQLAGLLTAAVGARVRLPGGLVIERARDALWVAARAEPAAAMRLAIPGETALPAFGLRVVAEMGEPHGRRPPDSAWEVWFDATALPAALEVRPRRAGDRVVPFGAGRPVRVAGLLAEAGIPRAVRGQWPLLVARGVEEEAVLWVVGVRRGAAAPMTPTTSVMLRVRAVLDPPQSSREDST